MTDVIGTISSVVQLADMVITYVNAVQEGKEKRLALSERIEHISKILQQILNFANQRSKKLEDFYLIPEVSRFRELLEMIFKALEEANSGDGKSFSDRTSREWRNKLKWPFVEAKFRVYLDQIAEYTASLSLALHAIELQVQLDMSQDMMSILSELRQMGLERASVTKKKHIEKDLKMNLSQLTELRDSNGSTPLITQANSGILENVRSLINAGASILKANWKGETALHNAVYANSPEIVDILCQHQNAKELVNKTITAWHETALCKAASDRRAVSCLEVLLRHGASTLSQNINGETVLHKAVWQGSEHVVRSILAKEDERNFLGDIATKHWKQTALHKAVSAGNSILVQILLEYGADRKREDFEGRTALDLAVQHNHEDIVALLKH